jgi:putative oxidoreductase
MPQPTLLIRLVDLYYAVARFLNRCQSPLLLIIRLYWAFLFWQAGWGKLQNLAQTTTNFANIGLPHPHFTAIFVSLVEVIGGILLALGLGSRFVALVLFTNMTVAYWVADMEDFRHILNDPDKFSSAAPFTYWAVALLILVFGPGYLALDTFVHRALGRSEARTQSI